jgi:hypothetical protein
VRFVASDRLESSREKRLYMLDLIEVGRVAQLVEQCPFKAWVAGSSPAALTIFLPRSQRVEPRCLLRTLNLRLMSVHVKAKKL